MRPRTREQLWPLAWSPFHAEHDTPAVIFHTCLEQSDQDRDGKEKKQGTLSWPKVLCSHFVHCAHKKWWVLSWAADAMVTPCPPYPTCLSCPFLTSIPTKLGACIHASTLSTPQGVTTYPRMSFWTKSNFSHLVSRSALTPRSAVNQLGILLVVVVWGSWTETLESKFVPSLIQRRMR